MDNMIGLYIQHPMERFVSCFASCPSNASPARLDEVVVMSSRWEGLCKHAAENLIINATNMKMNAQKVSGAIFEVRQVVHEPLTEVDITKVDTGNLISKEW
jgi:hypothetical protein